MSRQFATFWSEEVIKMYPPLRVYRSTASVSFIVATRKFPCVSKLIISSSLRLKVQRARKGKVPYCPSDVILIANAIGTENRTAQRRRCWSKSQLRSGWWWQPWKHQVIRLPAGNHIVPWLRRSVALSMMCELGAHFFFLWFYCNCNQFKPTSSLTIWLILASWYRYGKMVWYGILQSSASENLHA